MLWTCPLGFLRVGALNVGVLNKTKSALANPVLSKLISQFLNSHSSCSKTLNQNGSVFTWKLYLLYVYVKCVEDIKVVTITHLSPTVLKRDVFPTKRTFPQQNIEWLWLVRLGSWSFVGGWVKYWSFVGVWVRSWSFVGGRVKAGTEGQLLQDPIFSRILLWVQQHLCRWSTVALSIQTSFRLRCQHLKSTRGQGSFCSISGRISRFWVLVVFCHLYIWKCSPLFSLLVDVQTLVQRSWLLLGSPSNHLQIASFAITPPTHLITPPTLLITSHHITLHHPTNTPHHITRSRPKLCITGIPAPSCSRPVSMHWLGRNSWEQRWPRQLDLTE